MRTPPKCPDCGKDIDGVYKNLGDVPKTLISIEVLIPVGDSFLYWDWNGHKCKKKKRRKRKKLDNFFLHFKIKPILQSAFLFTFNPFPNCSEYGDRF